MHDILLVLVHAMVTVVRLMQPAGLRAVVAESALTRYQLLILNHNRKRAPNLRVSDRIIAGLTTCGWRCSDVGEAIFRRSFPGVSFGDGLLWLARYISLMLHPFRFAALLYVVSKTRWATTSARR